MFFGLNNTKGFLNLTSPVKPGFWEQHLLRATHSSKSTLQRMAPCSCATCQILTSGWGRVNCSDSTMERLQKCCQAWVGFLKCKSSLPVLIEFSWPVPWQVWPVQHNQSPFPGFLLVTPRWLVTRKVKQWKSWRWASWFATLLRNLESCKSMWRITTCRRRQQNLVQKSNWSLLLKDSTWKLIHFLWSGISAFAKIFWIWFFL